MGQVYQCWWKICRQKMFFFRVLISHFSRFISICDLFADSSWYICNRAEFSRFSAVERITPGLALQQPTPSLHLIPFIISAGRLLGLFYVENFIGNKVLITELVDIG
jgi:hypothetical protein